MCPSFRVWVLTTMMCSTVMLASGEESTGKKFETVRNSNAAILNRLGLVPVQIPEGHHKKRLAGPEPSGLVSAGPQTRIHQPYGRRHGHRDSHVYIVKLPASQPYYTLTKPHKPSSTLEQDKITKTTKITAGGSGPQVGFHSNGKPGKIYHWNLPIVKKMTEKKRLHSQFRIDQMRKKLEAEMNEQHRPQHDTRIHEEAEQDKRNAMLLDTAARPAGKPIRTQFNVKRYHHLMSSSNSLSHVDKPIKHVRNNDKRLNYYPRISEDSRDAGRPENLMKFGRRNGTLSNKMYRLEDSNLYRLGVGAAGFHSNDRLADWKLSNELYASRNTPPNGQKAKKHRKKAAMSYYAPINSSKIDDSSSIQKNFPGNGKPKAFYVMEKSRQPVYYHPLLP